MCTPWGCGVVGSNLKENVKISDQRSRRGRWSVSWAAATCQVAISHLWALKGSPALWRRHLTEPCRDTWQVYYALTNMLTPFFKFYTAMKGFCIAFLPWCSFDSKSAFAVWQSTDLMRLGCETRELTQTRGTQADCKPPGLNCKDELVEELRAQGVCERSLPPAGVCHGRWAGHVESQGAVRHSLHHLGSKGWVGIKAADKWCGVLCCEMKRWLVRGGNIVKKELKRRIWGVTSWSFRESFPTAGCKAGGARAAGLHHACSQCVIRIRNHYNCNDWNCRVMHLGLLNSGYGICMLISENNYLMSPKGSGWGPICAPAGPDFQKHWAIAYPRKNQAGK